MVRLKIVSQDEINRRLAKIRAELRTSYIKKSSMALFTISELMAYQRAVQLENAELQIKIDGVLCLLDQVEK